MSIWRCPHCGTPQAETARCWVCRRSSTTCSTCRNFRRSVAAPLAYCGLDSRHQPLNGTELRGCWDPGPSRTVEPVPGSAVAPIRQEPGRPRDFVPVELLRQPVASAFDEPMATARVAGDGARGPGERITLFGELEA